MLIKYFYLLLLFVVLAYIVNTNTTIEKFTQEQGQKEKEIEFEILENSSIKGSFMAKDNQEVIGIQLGSILLEFDYTNKNTGFSITFDGKKSSKQLVLEKDVKYEYELLLFPLDNLMFIFMKSNKDKDKRLFYTVNNPIISKSPAVKWKYTNNKPSIEYTPVDIKKVKYEIHLGNHELYKIMDSSQKVYFNASSSSLDLINKSEVGDKKTVIWTIEKRSNYFTIKNIVSNLYLSVQNSKLVMDSKQDTSTRYYIINTGKNNIIISHLGIILKLDKLEQNEVMGEIYLEKTENVGQWITYGSALHIVNSSNQYLSGNINIKYPSTGLFSVYSDDKGQKDLIQWTIEDYFGKKNGYFVKEGDDVYLKNNNMYLQIIKGNNSPSGSGYEISLGAQKNDNSKWIIRHYEGKDRLFRKGVQIYLYHPKMDVYLYNSDKKYMLLGSEKIDIIGYNRKEAKSVWKLETIVLDTNRALLNSQVDFYKYNQDQEYFKNKEKEWKTILEEQKKISQKQIDRFNELKEKEKLLEKSIIETNDKIRAIMKEKCPPTKLCVRPIDYDCIPNELKSKKDDKKGEESKYEIQYEKDASVKSNPYFIPSRILNKCKTVADFDITKNPAIKNKKYLLKDKAKTKIIDFDIKDFPGSEDLVPIDSIPDDKKITDFRIEELPGYEKLELKPELKK